MLPLSLLSHRNFLNFPGHRFDRGEGGDSAAQSNLTITMAECLLYQLDVVQTTK